MADPYYYFQQPHIAPRSTFEYGRRASAYRCQPKWFRTITPRTPRSTHSGQCLRASYIDFQNSWHHTTNRSVCFSTFFLWLRAGSISIATLSVHRRRMTAPMLASRNAPPCATMMISIVFVKTVFPRLGDVSTQAQGTGKLRLQQRAMC